MTPLLGLVAAYLAGGIPAAWIAGRALKGIDLRQHGSGNLGATNVQRVLGWRAAVAVLAFDVAKGLVPVLLFPRWFGAAAGSHWALGYGLAAIAGHVRSPWLLWRAGGKGVATASGVFLALAPVPTLLALAVWGITLWLWRYVSLASLAAAVALPLGVAWRLGPRSPVFALAVVVSLFVFWTHRANIGRLRRGEEHRAGGGAAP